MKRIINKLKIRKERLFVCVALAAMVWGVFGQTLRHEFINFDDNRYVYENPAVAQGLNRTGIAKAFTERYVGIWLPASMLSYQLDYELSGMNPSGFHRTNVLLHAATVILLFLLLHSMTGSLWQSAFVAALFAIHPLRAESVAWISERKDVLSGLFFMLTLSAYTSYTRSSDCRKIVKAGHYLLTILLFVLGLMSKPILVTLPCILLLLDIWPLGRMNRIHPKNAGIEKVPFFLISATFCVIAVWTQRDTATVGEDVTFLWRLGNAAVSYIVYIKQMIAPSGLALLYPHPGTTLPLWKISASLFLLLTISLTVLFSWKKRTYPLVGWFWYLGMLIPVIGIKQVGIHAHADRYTYLPQIGLYIVLAWGVADLSRRWTCRRIILSTGALIILASLGTGAWIQTSHWRDSESLWAHTLAHTEDNNISNYNLAAVLERNGKTDLAIEQYKRALHVWPQDTGALINLGGILAGKNQLGTAAELFRRALEIKPDSPEARTNLGIILVKQGRFSDAAKQYRQALDIKPDYLEACINLGVVFAKQARFETAIEHYRKALTIKPDSAETHYNLGIALSKLEMTDKAISHFQKAWETAPPGDLKKRSLNRANKLLMNWALPDKEDY